MSAPQSEIIWDHLRSSEILPRILAQWFLDQNWPCHCWTRHQDLQIIMVGQQSVTEMQYSWTSWGLNFPSKNPSETETGTMGRGRQRSGNGARKTWIQMKLGMSLVARGTDWGQDVLEWALLWPGRRSSENGMIWDVPRCPSCSLLHIM